MSNPNYSYPPTSAGGSFGPDRVWGTVFVIGYALMLFLFLLIVFGFAGLFAFSAGAGTKGQSSPFPPIFGAAFAAVAGFIVLISVGAHIVGAVGIHRSRAWGFWATIILSIISLGSSGGGTCFTIVPLIYSIMRLAGAYGPKPI